MLYFVRHGESQANVDEIFAGPHYYAPLTANGRDRAASEAARLKNESITFDTIIASPIERATDTAKIIAEGTGFDIEKIQFDPRLVEYDMGALSGQSMIGIGALERVGAEGAENPESFKERVVGILEDAKKMPGNTLLVSHAGVGRMIEVIRTSTDPARFYELQGYPNAQVVELRLDSNPAPHSK
jgi:probable phosphoglycerate mutase